MDGIRIPDKSLFKLSEVCELTGVKPYVLRFWESEFEEINPTVSSSGQKLYEHKEIELVALIKKLLFEDHMSIEEAKAEIKKAFSDLNQEEQRYLETELPRSGFKSLDLDHTEMKKLDLAKGNLRRILEKADSLKSRYGEDVRD